MDEEITELSAHALQRRNESARGLVDLVGVEKTAATEKFEREDALFQLLKKLEYMYRFGPSHYSQRAKQILEKESAQLRQLLGNCDVSLVEEVITKAKQIAVGEETEESELSPLDLKCAAYFASLLK